MYDPLWWWWWWLYITLVTYLPYARCYSQCCICIVPFDPHNNFMKKALLLVPVGRWGKLGTPSKPLAYVTQLANERAGVWVQAAWTKSLLLATLRIPIQELSVNSHSTSRGQSLLFTFFLLQFEKKKWSLHKSHKLIVQWTLVYPYLHSPIVKILPH